MKYLQILLLLLIVNACNLFQTKNQDVKFEADDSAQWITDTLRLPSCDSLFYLDNPAPLFRKEFVSGNDLIKATLLITAAGYYKASLNGLPIGKNELDPAWTDFSKRIYYSEYDVTSLLQNGENCIGVLLGNGFYNPLPLRKWGSRNLRNDLAKVGKPIFIAKLHMQYKNGKYKEIVSDSSWKFAYSPYIKNHVYTGVVYDALHEIIGWNKTGLNDTKWSPAIIGENPGGKLQKSFSPPVQVTKKIIPVALSSPVKGIYVVDMGMNFTGTYKIKLSGNIGDTIVFRFGERIYDNGKLDPMTTVAGQIKHKGVGGPGAPEIAWQTDSYIIGSDKEVLFKPEFTFHTYRYMEISGLKKQPVLSDIEGLYIHSNVENINSFTSSSELLDSIQQATRRTFLSNLISVQSDCAARERFGYGGDLNATCESFIYNFDMQSFYRKTIFDWVDAMKDSTFVDTAPFVGVEYCGISWESAFIITQYYLYLYYNDTGLVKNLYETDKKWMNKVARIYPKGLVNNGLSDHESMISVPVQLTGTCHYLQCARIMQTFAVLMGDEANEEKYENLAKRLKDIVKSKFWDKPVEGKINRQTLFATLLYHGIVPENEEAAAKDSLIKAVKNGPSEHFSTGIFGTKYILEALSEYGYSNIVYNIVNSTEYPGWGFMIDRGATTIWETWKESDNTFSNCHPMFGSVSEWYYRWLGGIRPIPETPGFKKFIISPSTPEGLNFVHCTYCSPFGKIVSNWEKESLGGYCYNITIPSGSTAKVTIPLNPDQEILIKKEYRTIEPDEIEGLETGKFDLTEGKYVITVSLK